MPAKNTQETDTIEHVATAPAPQGSNIYAVLALVFGLVSLTGFGFILGVPAIILASISLKRGLPEKGLSITGLVTGIVSTVFSLLFLVLVILAFIWGANHPEELQQGPADRRPNTEQRFESSRT